MLLPRGQPLHENLSTAFTQFNGVIADLKGNRFSGYMRLTAGEYEGVLFFDTGNVVGAIDEVKGERRNGSVAAQAIAAKGEEKNGLIVLIPIVAIVFSLGIPIIAIITEAAKHRKIYELFHKERLAAIEKGIELPPLPLELFDRISKTTPPP